MQVKFWRYSATGNTFLIFNNLTGELSNVPSKRLGEIATNHEVDGLLFLEEPKNGNSDFHMRYVNADGGEVEMCGNGARSIIHFAKEVAGLTPKNKNRFIFSTLNSLYEGQAEEDYPVKMTEIKDWDAIDVSDLFESNYSYYMNTGVPHAIYEVKKLDDLNLQEAGSKIRYDKRFERGTNANFFEIKEQGVVNMRTYERGVEGETQSCGTGATATALSLAKLKGWPSPIQVNVPGGKLIISFNEDFSEVFLKGPVVLLEENSLEL